MATTAIAQPIEITFPATGFFRTAQIGGRWWFVDPDGHPFFSQGVNNLSFAGTPDVNGVDAYEDAVTARYGTPAKWATAEAARLHAELLPVHAGVTSLPGVISLKTAMNMLGLPGGPVRLPLVEATEEQQSRLKTFLAQGGVKI